MPHLPDLGRQSMWGDGGTTIQQLIHAQFQYQCSRLYRPADQSVVQTSFSSLTLVFKLQLSLRFQLVQLICVQCVWVSTFRKVTIFSLRLLWWTNVYTLMCFCLLPLVSVRLAFSSCVTALFYLVCFEVYLVLIGWAAIPGWMPL